MAELPETHESLLVKLRDPLDAAAWYRFVEVYRPAVLRLARRCGLQEADAEDMAQRVMASVSRTVGEWRKDATRGTFRGWLLTIARNEITNALTRGRKQRGRGGTSVMLALEKLAVEEDALESLVEDEHRRAVFRWATEQVRPEFQEATWQAFWRTTVDGRAPEEVAPELGKTLGAVYAARSRVMRRLQELVREMEGRAEEGR